MRNSRHTANSASAVGGIPLHQQVPSAVKPSWEPLACMLSNHLLGVGAAGDDLGAHRSERRRQRAVGSRINRQRGARLFAAHECRQQSEELAGRHRCSALVDNPARGAGAVNPHAEVRLPSDHVGAQQFEPPLEIGAARIPTGRDTAARDLVTAQNFAGRVRRQLSQIAPPWLAHGVDHDPQRPQCVKHWRQRIEIRAAHGEPRATTAAARLPIGGAGRVVAVDFIQRAGRRPGSAVASPDAQAHRVWAARGVANPQASLDTLLVRGSHQRRGRDRGGFDRAAAGQFQGLAGQRRSAQPSSNGRPIRS